MFWSRAIACVLGALLIASCKTTGPNVPYPAYVVPWTDLPDMFIAGLPGVRAKPLVGATSDATGGSFRIDLPTSWQGTSGAAPDKSLEIFVIEGELSVADVRLKRGGYAYLPPGTLGFNLKSATGARSSLLPGRRRAIGGYPDAPDTGEHGTRLGRHGHRRAVEERTALGSRQWCTQLAAKNRAGRGDSLGVVFREPRGLLPHRQVTRIPSASPASRAPIAYLPGMYLYRPGDSINGGPESVAETTSIWFFRELSESDETTHDRCEITATTY